MLGGFGSELRGTCAPGWGWFLVFFSILRRTSSSALRGVTGVAGHVGCCWHAAGLSGLPCLPGTESGACRCPEAWRLGGLPRGSSVCSFASSEATSPGQQRPGGKLPAALSVQANGPFGPAVHARCEFLADDARVCFS